MFASSNSVPIRNKKDSPDLCRMLDLPTELKCQIPQYLITEEQHDTYFAFIQTSELSELVGRNFMHQLNLIR